MQVLNKILEEIEREKGNIENYNTVEDRRLVRHWNNCIDVIKDIICSHMKDDGWIPVEEYLPQEIGIIIHCFVEMKHKESDTGFRTMIDWNDGCWKWSNGKKLSDKYEVLAWQKIKYPESYIRK